MTESTYCVVCGDQVTGERLSAKAITCDPAIKNCKKEWRKRWRNMKKSFRVAPHEFAMVQVLRREGVTLEGLRLLIPKRRSSRKPKQLAS